MKQSHVNCQQSRFQFFPYLTEVPSEDCFKLPFLKGKYTLFKVVQIVFICFLVGALLGLVMPSAFVFEGMMTRKITSLLEE
jgi:hypothetical protein